MTIPSHGPAADAMKEQSPDDVLTGEVKIGALGAVLTANALGSCVAVMMLDRPRKIGGIAHVMLPGRASAARQTFRLRYAEDAVDELLRLLREAGSHLEDLTVCIAGGANVLERSEDVICERNIGSVTRTLLDRGIIISARSVGGTRRRRVKLNIEHGCFFCAIGDGQEHLLWSRETGAVRTHEAVL